METRQRSKRNEKPLRIQEVDDDSPNEWRTKKANDRQARERKGKGKAIQTEEPRFWLRDDEPFNSAIRSIRDNTLTIVDDDRKLVRKFVGQKMNPTTDYKKMVDKLAINTSPRLNYESLDALGIGNDIRWYLGALRLSSFVEIDYPAYIEEARQFLATVQLSFPRCKHPLARDGILEFIIDERRYTLSIPEMSTCLGLDMSDVVDYGSFSGASFWSIMANGDYDAKTSKSSMLTHPAIRVTHRILASTLFCRNNQTGVLTDELITLQMPFVEAPISVSYAALLATRLVKVKHEAVTCKDSAPSTTYGTAITAIMVAAGVDFSDRIATPRKKWLDLFSLNTMRIIKGATTDPDRFGYQYPTPPNLSRLILLPSTSVPRLHDGHTSWTPREDEFLNLRTGETLPLTIGQFVRNKARDLIRTERRARVPSHTTETTALEEERARSRALEEQYAAQSRELARMQRLLRRSGLDDSQVHSDDSTSD